MERATIAKRRRNANELRGYRVATYKKSTHGTSERTASETILLRRSRNSFVYTPDDLYESTRLDVHPRTLDEARTVFFVRIYERVDCSPANREHNVCGDRETLHGSYEAESPVIEEIASHREYAKGRSTPETR